MFIKNRKSFSLIELMIVIAIIGILVAVLLPQLSSMTEDAQKSQAEQSLSAIRDAVVRYNANNPDEECQDLEWLVPRYIAESKPDPWNNPYTIERESGVVYSAGPDQMYGNEGGAGVIEPMDRDDNIMKWYKPQLMVEDALYSDNNNNGSMDAGDTITIIFTKSARRSDGAGGTQAEVPADFQIYSDGSVTDSSLANMGDFTVKSTNMETDVAVDPENYSRYGSKYKVTLEMTSGTPASPYVWFGTNLDYRQLYINTAANDTFEDEAYYMSIQTPRNVPIRRTKKRKRN